MTGLAFATFADAPVDVVVLETGMGGTWDATNVADAAVAVITPIALDHMDYLGADLESIAGEKAGIIKPGASVVLAAQELEAAEVLLRRCVETEATVAREGVEFGVVDRRSAVGGQLLDLQGPRRALRRGLPAPARRAPGDNAAIAIAAVEAFLGGGGRSRSTPTSSDRASPRSSRPAGSRWCAAGPTVIVDAAHNPHGARALAAAIADGFEFSSLVGVVGVLADKDARGVLQGLEPVLSEVIVTRSSSPRATDVDTLAAIAVEVFGAERVEVVARLADALDTAIERADERPASWGEPASSSPDRWSRRRRRAPFSAVGRPDDGVPAGRGPHLRGPDRRARHPCRGHRRRAERRGRLGGWHSSRSCSSSRRVSSGGRYGVAVGWVLQVLVCLSGLLVPAMGILGLLFLGVWVVALVYGAKGERLAAQARAKEAARRRQEGSVTPAATDDVAGPTAADG